MSLDPINSKSIHPPPPSKPEDQLSNLKDNKQFRKKIRFIIKEALERTENSSVYNLILKVIDYIREQFGSTTTINKKLEQKISSYLPSDLQNNAELIKEISVQILSEPQSFKSEPQFLEPVQISPDFQVFTYQKKDTEDVRFKWHMSQLEKDENFQTEIQPFLKELSDANKSQIKDVIKNHLPETLRDNSQLIETLTNFVITKSQSSKKKTTVLEKNDSQRDFALDRLFKKTSFAFRMLGNKPINIQSLVNKLLPASMAGNIELVESIISYITDNKETLLDEILKAQLDQLLNIGPLRQASRDLFLKDLPPEANKIAIQEWLKRVIQYPLSTNTTFMNALSTYIETHMETIKQQIEAIDEKFSKNTLDFYTYEMLKNPAFQEKFLTIIAEDTQNPLDAFKALVNRMISKNPDPLLEEDIAQYIIANKDVLKEKAREIKILRFIECVNSKDIRKIDLRIKQEVEKTEVEKNDEQFLKDIGDIFRLQSPPLTQNELDLTTKYILENKEEIAELIRIRLKSELRRNMN